MRPKRWSICPRSLGVDLDLGVQHPKIDPSTLSGIGFGVLPFIVQPLGQFPPYINSLFHCNWVLMCKGKQITFSLQLINVKFTLKVC